MTLFRSTRSHALLAAGLAGCLAAGTASASDNSGQGHAYAYGHGYSFDFEINNRRIEPSADFAAQVSVLGAAITYGEGGYDLPVTLRIEVGDGEYDTFGDADSATQGNVNDHSPARHVILDSVFEEGNRINLTATSWLAGTSYWKRHLTISTDDDSDNVLVLRNGDTVPNINAFGDQAGISDYLTQYIDADTRTVTIADDQIIYLFELGATDPSTPDADFQDLVVLITLGDSPEALEMRAKAALALYD